MTFTSHPPSELYSDADALVDVTQIISKLNEVKSICSSIDSATSGLPLDIQTRLNALQETLNTKFSEVISDITSESATTNENIASLQTYLVNELSGLLTSINGTADSNTTNIIGAVSTAVTDLVEILTDYISTAKNDINSHADSNKAALDDSISTAVAALESNSNSNTSTLSSAISTLSSYLTTVYNNLVTAISNASTDIKSTISGYITTAKNDVNTHADSNKTELDTSITNAVNAIEADAATNKNTLNTAITSVYSYITTVYNNLVTAISNASTAIQNNDNTNTTAIRSDVAGVWQTGDIKFVSNAITAAGRSGWTGVGIKKITTPLTMSSHYITMFGLTPKSNGSLNTSNGVLSKDKYYKIHAKYGNGTYSHLTLGTESTAVIPPLVAATNTSTGITQLVGSNYDGFVYATGFVDANDHPTTTPYKLNTTTFAWSALPSFVNGLGGAANAVYGSYNMAVVLGKYLLVFGGINSIAHNGVGISGWGGGCNVYDLESGTVVQSTSMPYRARGGAAPYVRAYAQVYKVSETSALLILANYTDGTSTLTTFKVYKITAASAGFASLTYTDLTLEAANCGLTVMTREGYLTSTGVTLIGATDTTEYYFNDSTNAFSSATVSNKSGYSNINSSDINIFTQGVGGQTYIPAIQYSIGLVTMHPISNGIINSTDDIGVIQKT